MPNNLFLLDLDLTLIDKNYGPTIHLGEFKKIVKQREQKGDIFGLISDTPYQTLKQRMEEFQFHGPVVSEKGAIITWPSGKQQVTFMDTIDWPLLKERLLEALRRSFPKAYFVEIGYRVFLQSPQNIPAGSNMVVIINPYRKHSFGIHIRGINSTGQIIEDLSVFQEVDVVFKETLDHYSLLQSFSIDSNPTYFVIILSNPRVDKRLAMPLLREHYLRYQLVVIGNDSSEAILKGYVDKLGAVGNATEDLKKVADIVAHSDYTVGVLEILRAFNQIGKEA